MLPGKVLAKSRMKRDGRVGELGSVPGFPQRNRAHGEKRGAGGKAHGSEKAHRRAPYVLVQRLLPPSQRGAHEGEASHAPSATAKAVAVNMPISAWP